ncbi:MAG: MnhB domain-containing protein [Elusimicrobiota bacterium]
MDSIVRYITRFLIGPIFVFASYVIIYGHILPGEGFDGGALIASVFILCMIVFGRGETHKKLNISGALIASTISGLAMMALGFLGLAGVREGRSFLFDNFLPQGDVHNLFSGGIVPIFNLILGILVGAGFYALFGYLITYRRDRE